MRICGLQCIDIRFVLLFAHRVASHTDTYLDLTGPIENAVKKVDSSFDAEGCELYFCRGARVSILAKWYHDT